MKERSVDINVPFPANDEPAEVVEPGERSFNLPASAVASQRPAVLCGGTPAALAMRADQLDPSPSQPLAMRIRVIGPVRGQSFRLALSTTLVMRLHARFIQGGLQQRHLRRRGRCQTEADRNSPAVRHHHALCALAAFGFSDTIAPFFAGKKLASTNASSQSSQPAWSRSARKVRQISTHTPCSSQSRRRRQHVLGDGYRSGRSCHLAPLRRIQRMPSTTRRLSIRLRPPLGDCTGCGSSGSIRAHCWSVSNGRAFRAITATPFARNDHRLYKLKPGASSHASQF